MKKLSLCLLVVIACCANSSAQKTAPQKSTTRKVIAQTAAYRFDNEFGKYGNRNDYYNWKVFLIAANSFLQSIKHIEYYLDPTYKNSKRIVKADVNNPNFTLCNNGWGEFTLRIKIVFNDPRVPAINDVHPLDLHSAAKKNTKYVCRL